jgi:hypothetical protein
LEILENLCDIFEHVHVLVSYGCLLALVFIFWIAFKVKVTVGYMCLGVVID